MIGTVQELGTTQKGSPKVKIGGTWHYPGRNCSTQGLSVGLEIDYQTKAFTAGDKVLSGLELWRVAGDAPAPLPAPKANGKASTGYIDPAHMPFVSNTVAHAIAAGLLKSPSEVRPWVEACHSALTFPFDDKIPF